MQKLIDRLVEEFVLDTDSFHGLSHWQRVEAYGTHIAKSNGANIKVVRLFAYFHDCCRVSESHDSGHGLRGAKKARALRAELGLNDDALETLFEACAGHTDLIFSHNPTIAACWDADRLDLDRVGIDPDPSLLSTAEGKRLAALNTLTRRKEVGIDLYFNALLKGD